MKYSVIAALAAVASAASSSSDFPTIEIVGNKFFYSNNGSQFYMKGIAYQEAVSNQTDDTSFTDPLADGDACKRDIPYLQELQTNVIRVYAINASQDHDACMSALQDAGIYVISDLSEPSTSIIRSDPKWDVELYQRYAEVVDILAQYDNVLGFFAGNEVTNNASNTDASAFVKAAVRDMKAYIKQKGYRSIPVGYSSNDDSETREAIADYFACGSEDERADFYGINMYEWCGNSSFKESGYEARTKEFEGYPVPLFFSEYGCNEVQPREFTEVETLYSSDMTDVWSGGIVYMYFQETNNYGLVSIDNGKVSTLDDFNNLSKEMAKISPTSASASAATESGSTINCPASTASTWKANSALPPRPTQAVCDCISSAAACVVDSGTDEDDYGDMFSYLCGEIDCSEITANGTSGEYGGLSFCNPKDQLNFLLNKYYSSNGKSSSACDFSGKASVNESPKTASSCSSIVEQAATATGAISASQTGVAAGSGSDNSSSSGSSSGSSSHGSSDAVSVNGQGMKALMGAAFAVGAGLFVVM